MKTHVLICSHNGGKYIADQLKSIFSQTSPVDKIWVFDFASTDNTLKVLNQLAKMRPANYITISQEVDAPGASLSFFRAIKHMENEVAAEDLVFFCDQDDFWNADKVESVSAEFERQLQRHAAAPLALFHDVAVVDEHLNMLRPTYYTGDPFRIPRDLASDRLLLANPIIGHTMAISGSLLRCVAQIEKPAAYLMHDWAAALIASRIGHIEFVPKVLSLYRQHNQNVLGAYGRRRKSEIFQRTVRFSRGVARQALAMPNDIARVSGHGASAVQLAVIPRTDRLLMLSNELWPWFAFPLLATLAAFRGPTYKRRLLSAAMLIAAVWPSWSKSA